MRQVFHGGSWNNRSNSDVRELLARCTILAKRPDDSVYYACLGRPVCDRYGKCLDNGGNCEFGRQVIVVDSSMV